MTTATATPSTLLQLSVHRLAQHSVAKSSGIMTWVGVGVGVRVRVGVGVRVEVRVGAAGP
eukprot:scaffold24880_cov48-Phaeocystis_antarctica.AAC.3